VVDDSRTVDYSRRRGQISATNAPPFGGSDRGKPQNILSEDNGCPGRDFSRSYRDETDKSQTSPLDSTSRVRLYHQQYTEQY
jgi:hypothetical protein